MQLLWIELTALLLLIAILVLRCWQRSRRVARAEAARPLGHGFDTTLIGARLKEIRRDYTGSGAPRSRRSPNHDVIAIAVRRSLATLSYFRSARLRQTELPSPPEAEGFSR